MSTPFFFAKKPFISMPCFVCGTNPKLPEVEDAAVAESFPVASSFP